MAPLGVVATLGPASAELSTITALAAVVDRFRLNTSHLDPPELERWLAKLASLDEALRRPIVLDLQGAKMRVGELAEPLTLSERVVFTRDDDKQKATSTPRVFVPHPPLFAAVQPGERLWLDDARIEVVVESASAEHIEGRVTRAGILQSHKGINRPEHPIPCTTLGQRDEAMIALAQSVPGCELAFSFVHDGSEAELLRKACSKDLRLVAKIERAEAFSHLGAIADSFDELWLCRGDLGSQAGVWALGPLQARFSAALPTLKRPGLLAGQVLEHLTHHAQPTRSEVVHLYDVARAGYAGIVLSDETAIGKELPAVIAFLSELRRLPST